MQMRSVIVVAIALLSVAPRLADAQTEAQSVPFEKLAAECAPDVHPSTLKGVVRTESSWNPYAIGVVGGHLNRQPRSMPEAVATARELERQGFNFSMGLGQINRHNLVKYGESYETVFDPCRNLKVGSAILKDCFQRAKRQVGDDQRALQAALSCYYSGNFMHGLSPDIAGQPSYVQKVVANSTGGAQPILVVPAITTVSSDAAVAAQSTCEAATPVNQATSARWVIFTDVLQQGRESATVAHAEFGESGAVKARLVTPVVGSARVDQAPTQRDAQTIPAQGAQSQRDTHFVQFAN
jgi:type IV secretion system protein VirB1